MQVINPFETILNELAEIKKAVQEIATNEPKTPELNPLIDRKEIVEIFGVNQATIWRWQNKGILKPKKIGGRVYFDRDEVISAIKNS